MEKQEDIAQSETVISVDNPFEEEKLPLKASIKKDTTEDHKIQDSLPNI